MDLLYLSLGPSLNMGWRGRLYRIIRKTASAKLPTCCDQAFSERGWIRFVLLVRCGTITESGGRSLSWWTNSWEMQEGAVPTKK